MNRKIRNAIINLLKQYLIENHLYNEDNRNTERTEKPILILITRKGYWLFRLLYDEWCEKSTVDLRIFNEFTIYSDRYLTKVIDTEIFNDKKVLIFDDIMVHGNNLFYYYVMLEKWGAVVTPLTLECDLSLYNVKSGDKTKESIYHSFHPEEDTSDTSDTSYKKAIKRFWEVQTPYKDERFWLTPDDLADDSVYQLFLFQKNLCPMSMDLPIIGQKASEENKINRYVTLSKEQWEQIRSQRQRWNFVENIENIKDSYKINASFFQANECFHQLNLWGEIQDCIVKCKYEEDESSGNVKAVFVPYVIFKSMSYFHVANLFCELYENTTFEAYLKQKMEVSEMPLKQKLFEKIKEYTNLYCLLYRSIVWYFSIFIGNRFIKFLEENGVEHPEYDERFMEHHMQDELKDTIRDLCEDTESLEKKLAVGSVNTTPNIDDEMDQEYMEEFWQWAFFDLKKSIVDMQFQKNRDFKDIISIDQMESQLAEFMEECNRAELRYILTKIIVLLQEESSVSNYIINDQKNGFVRSGFRPAENGMRIVEESAKEILPYVYAFYLQMGDEEKYTSNYQVFMDRLESYLYSEQIFEYHLDPSAFLYYEGFFYPEEDNESTSIAKKMSQVRFLIGEYLDGDTHEYDNAFTLVSNWEF